MKKTLIFLLSLCLTLSLTEFLASETQDVTIILKVITDQANIRENPDLGSKLIYQVPQGTTLESTGKTGEWYQVQSKTSEGKPVSGYVHQSLVTIIKRIPRKIPEKKSIKKPVFRKEKEGKPVFQEIQEIPSPKRPSRNNVKYIISFSGGGNYISGDDLNSGTNGFIQFFKDEMNISENVKTNNLHLSYIIGGEFGIALFPQFHFVIGIDFFQAKRDQLVEYQVNSAKATFSSRPKIKAVPIRAVFSYYLHSSLYVKGGIEYFIAKCSYFNRYDLLNSWEEKSGQARAQGFGFLGAIGTELELAPNLTFFIEANGRYAKIGGLKGNGIRKNSDGSSISDEGNLFLYHKLSSNQNSFPQVEVRESKPSAGGEIDPRRKAILDLTGISLKIGFRIRI